ncbi:MAG: hypothetical protein OEQ29_14405 [Alphaproteobacteria bacterium]|nr:hypothetical protein [Alphaproteobacteria bacterium]
MILVGDVADQIASVTCTFLPESGIKVDDRARPNREHRAIAPGRVSKLAMVRGCVADGSITGFGGGVETKKYLLNLERGRGLRAHAF